MTILTYPCKGCLFIVTCSQVCDKLKESGWNSILDDCTKEWVECVYENLKRNTCPFCESSLIENKQRPKKVQCSVCGCDFLPDDYSDFE